MMEQSMKSRKSPRQFPLGKRVGPWFGCILVATWALAAANGRAGGGGSGEFAGRIDLDGDISDFLDADGRPLPGVHVQEDRVDPASALPGVPPEVSLGLSDEAGSRFFARDLNLHPSGFNLRRVLTAYNPGLDGGTLYIGLDLPGGSGTRGNPAFDNMDYGGVITRGQVCPFDADGNGEADFIGRTCDTDAATCFSSCLEADGCPDIWRAGVGAGAFAAGDNPRGGLMASMELYQVRVTFGGGETITLALLQDYFTAAGKTDFVVFDNGLPFAARVSTDTGGDGEPQGYDIEFAIANLNQAVAEETHRRMWWIEAMTGFTGGPSGGDYIFMDPAPALSIENSGDYLTISWGPQIPGYHLEQAEDLLRLEWHPVSSGDRAPVTLPASAATGIFRLIKD